MIISLIEMLQLPNFGHIITIQIQWSLSHAVKGRALTIPNETDSEVHVSLWFSKQTLETY